MKINIRPKNSQLIIQLLAIVICLISSSIATAYEKVKFVEEFRDQMQQPVDMALSSDGRIFILDEALGEIFVYDAEGKVTSRLGVHDPDDMPLIGPRSMALSDDGKLAVADTANHRVVILDRKGNVLFKFGDLGSSAGQFRHPVSVVMDQAGFIYVADQENRRIQAFSPKGIFLNYFPVDSQPAALSIDREGYLYVLLPSEGRVLKYNVAGNKEKEIMCSVDGRNMIEKATGLNIDFRGDLYIIEGTENSIKKFDQSGELLISFGSYGNGRGQFSGPVGIKSDMEGRIYVADKGNGRIQVLRILGNQKSALKIKRPREVIVDFYSETAGYEGASDLFHNNNTLYILSDMNNKVVGKGRHEIQFGSLGIDPGEFSNPQTMFAGWDDKIYVANTGNNNIQIFQENGVLEYQFGREGENPGEFNAPHGVVVNSKGTIFVADTNNNRIQYFNNDGIYLGVFDGAGAGNENSASRLRYPKAIAADSQDRVFVVDSDGTRIMVFNSNGQFLGKLDEYKESFMQRERIADIYFDVNDNMLLLDAFNSRVKVINRYGEYVASFGAQGTGRGYFQNASSIAVGEGKIYVSDYDLNKIQVFRYYLDGLANEERIFSTRMMECEENEDLNIIARYTKAIKKGVAEARAELNKELKLSLKELHKVTKIETIEKANNGQVKITVSMPRHLLDKLIDKEAPKTKKVIDEKSADQ